MADVQPLVIIAAWGSGSSAAAGFLHHCGAYTCPPHQRTNDERTPSAFEPYAYAKALRQLFDETTLKKTGDTTEFTRFFEAFWEAEVAKAMAQGFGAIALKHPLQALVLPYLQRRLKPKYLFVTRPLDDIEKTRIRRKWHATCGAAGAKHISAVATNFLVENSCPFLTVPYKALMQSADFRSDLLAFCGLAPDGDRLQKAEHFLLRR